MNRFRVNLIVLVLLLLLSAQNVLADSKLYKAGVVFYKQGKYQEALKYFSDAVKENPDDIDSLYYFANTLVKTNNVDYAQKYYQRVIDIDPDYYIADYARKALSDISNSKKEIRTPYSSLTKKGNKVYSSINSYISNITENGTIIHWDKLTMPLKVYIKKPEYSEHHKYVLAALAEWNSMSEGLIGFKSTISEKDANIVINWGKTLYKSPNYDFYGFVEPVINNKELKKYNIYIQETDNKGKMLLPSLVRLAILHQIGHGLGLNAHSSNKKDLMYVSPVVDKLSSQDIATINLLYEMPADVSNFSEAARVKAEAAKRQAESEKE